MNEWVSVSHSSTFYLFPSKIPFFIFFVQSSVCSTFIMLLMVVFFRFISHNKWTNWIFEWNFFFIVNAPNITNGRTIIGKNVNKMRNTTRTKFSIIESCSHWSHIVSCSYILSSAPINAGSTYTTIQLILLMCKPFDRSRELRARPTITKSINYKNM